MCIEKYSLINIEEHINSKLIVNAKEKKEIIGLDGVAINEISFFEFGKINFIDNIPYIFTKVEEGDNITCENQEIIIKKDYYNKIYFAGNVYWGAKYDFVRIAYDDSTDLINKKVCFLDWSRLIKRHEDLLIEGMDKVKVLRTCVSCGKSYMGSLYIYEYSFCLDNTKKLEKIILPDNFLMHIYAITLEKSHANTN